MYYLTQLYENGAVSTIAIRRRMSFRTARGLCNDARASGSIAAMVTDGVADIVVCSVYGPSLGYSTDWYQAASDKMRESAAAMHIKDAVK